MVAGEYSVDKLNYTVRRHETELMVDDESHDEQTTGVGKTIDPTPPHCTFHSLFGEQFGRMV